ncbi:hypothetical protein P2F94_11860 [Mannheimia haemolytica]|nr:hypothetical protein [Mannheimia haemolytica]MDW0567908.1 hypothetical protein [Mannheimia haemolytica]MDW0638946.1 hypothetical protein [Mannheimia haemolytica]
MAGRLSASARVTVPRFNSQPRVGGWVQTTPITEVAAVVSIRSHA